MANKTKKRPPAPVMTDPSNAREKILAAKRAAIKDDWPSDPDKPASRAMYDKSRKRSRRTTRQ